MFPICDRCGHTNPEGARVCAVCGHALGWARSKAGPLAAPVFVGRQQELETLQQHLAEAIAGRGSLTMLVGEAGVGKTRVAHEFAEHARQQGVAALWGSCHEGEWQPPYAPWVEALGTYAATLDRERLRRALGAGASPLAQLVPQIRLALPDIPDPAPLGPQEERFRLFDAVTQYLLAAARETPLLLVLDDLHWADADSLWLLRHLGRFLQQGRVLLTAVYRDPEAALHQHHALVEALGLLKREADFRRIVLRGLSGAEVAAYLAQTLGAEAAGALADAVYRETDGNPFYIREIVGRLLEEQRSASPAAQGSSATVLAGLGIPAGVRQVINQRLSRLSEKTITMLRLAAAFGGGFAFASLRALADLSEEEAMDCLDEALQAGFLRVAPETPPSYGFSHTIVRHTLYDEINPDRRARLHYRIAHVLEQVYAGREMEHAAELAAHYDAAAGLPGAAQGVRYAVAAAEQARAVYAPARAVTYLRMARELARQIPEGEDPVVRVRILRELAIAEAEALLWEEVQDAVQEALAALCERTDAPDACAGFLSRVVRALKDGGAPLHVWEPLLERGLELVAERRDLLWARLMLLRSDFEPLVNVPVHGGQWLGFDPQAVAIARAQGDEDDYAWTVDPLDWRSRQETDAVLALARRWQRPTAVLRALEVVARDLWYRHGAYRESLEQFQEVLATAERYGAIPAQAEALLSSGGLRIILGETAPAQETLLRAHELAARLGTEHRLRWIETGTAILLADYLGGDWAGLADAASRFTGNPAAAWSPVGLPAAAAAALCHARAGNHAQARTLLAALTPLVQRMRPTAFGHVAAVAWAAMALWETEDSAYAEVYRRLAHEHLAMGDLGSSVAPPDLSVARMAALLGDMDEAKTFFARARESAEAGGLRPLRALADYDEALALVRAGMRDAARTLPLLDAALASFRALGMEPWTERAEAQRQWVAARQQKGASASRYPDSLTAREVELLALLAGGKTSREIAAQLALSVLTVHRHIANIYNKINARNRADATAYAIRHGIVPPTAS